MKGLSTDDLPTALEDWLLLNDRKATTAKGHKNQLRLLVKNGVPLKKDAVEHFLADLKRDNYSSSHINSFVGTVRVLVQFCKDQDYEIDEDLADISFVKDKYKPKATMTDEEIEAFLDLSPPTVTHKHNNSDKMITRPVNPKAHKYWTVFFSIMAYTGMRTGEVSKLRVKDVDLAQGTFYLKDTKTNDNRIVPIPENIKDIVKDWIRDIGEGYLFYSNRPEGHTSSVEWNYNFHTRIKRLGIKRENLTPYSIRHSFITTMLQEEGVNIFDVKNLVGHKDTRTTEHYYHLGTKRLKRVIAKHPNVRRDTDPSKVLSMVEDFIDSLDLDSRFNVEKTRKSESLVVKIEL